MAEAGMGKKALPILTINEGGNKGHHPDSKTNVAKGKGHVKGKGKRKAKIEPPKPKEKKAKVATSDPCFECGEIGHGKRNCPTYLKELKTKRDAGQTSEEVVIKDMSSDDKKKYKNEKMMLSLLQQAVKEDIMVLLQHNGSSYSIWKALRSKFVGSQEMVKNKKSLLKKEFDLFRGLKNETYTTFVAKIEDESDDDIEYYARQMEKHLKMMVESDSEDEKTKKKKKKTVLKGLYSIARKLNESPPLYEVVVINFFAVC
ncbi:uncharacterized protein LOC118490452 [Helianthus annuus]|uniref:uncharacterized protein LOC118490452 n=1 Tax=Helianthus annuus TaxID=4232 RepID=UPI001652DF37|nr:uncharacterized protein LOC118490452 [Helianthus annuus]